MATVRKVQVDKKNGVTVSPWKGHRLYKWRVSFPDGAGRKSKGFKAKSGAEGALAFADLKRGLITSDGTRHESITDEERRAVIAFREMLAELPESMAKPTLADAITLMRENLGVRQKSATIDELKEKFMAAMKRRKVSAKHLYNTEQRLDKFTEDYGQWLACDMSAEVIGDWLEELCLADQTTNHHRAALVQIFKQGLALRMVTENPAALVEKRKVGGTVPGVLTVPEVASILFTAADEIMPALLIGFFAGVRRAELGRMDWQELDFDQDYIEIPAAKAKGAARRIIAMRPNLKAWLLPLRQLRGPIMPSEMIYRSRLADAREAAGITSWPNNALRHSFASYHLAAFADAPALALEMGHMSTKMIFDHYRAVVAPAKGKAFWEIMPAGEGEKITQMKTA